MSESKDDGGASWFEPGAKVRLVERDGVTYNINVCGGIIDADGFAAAMRDGIVALRDTVELPDRVAKGLLREIARRRAYCATCTAIALARRGKR